MNYDPYQYDPYREYTPWQPQEQTMMAPIRKEREHAPTPSEELHYQEKPKLLRMPKEQAMLLAGSLKRWILTASLVGFAGLGWLVINNPVGTSASPIPVQQGPTQVIPAQPEPSEDGGGFFHRSHGGSHFGNDQSAQPPASGSTVS